MTGLPPLVSPAEDPRASGSIRRAKAWCGLAGFALAAVSSHVHGATLAGLLAHALVAGIVGNLLGWAVATTVWRRLMKAETRRAVDLIVARRTGGDT